MEDISKQPPNDERHYDGIGLKDAPIWFVGLTIGNIIGDHLFHTNLSDGSAPIRGAIATGIVLVIAKGKSKLLQYRTNGCNQ